MLISAHTQSINFCKIKREKKYGDAMPLVYAINWNCSRFFFASSLRYWDEAQSDNDENEKHTNYFHNPSLTKKKQHHTGINGKTISSLSLSFFAKRIEKLYFIVVVVWASFLIFPFIFYFINYSCYFSVIGFCLFNAYSLTYFVSVYKFRWIFFFHTNFKLYAYLIFIFINYVLKPERKRLELI